MVFPEPELLSRSFHLFLSFSKFILNRSSALQTAHDFEVGTQFVADLEL